MARMDRKKKLRPSLLDRLIDNEPHNQTENDQGRHQLLRQMRDSVRRDLETLLNTRYHIIAPPEEYTELEKSLLNYGLPDLATVNGETNFPPGSKKPSPTSSRASNPYGCPTLTTRTTRIAPFVFVSMRKSMPTPCPRPWFSIPRLNPSPDPSA